MQTRGFHHLAVQVRDLEGACRFYRDVLGLKELSRHHRADGSLRSVWLEVAPGFLALEEASGAGSADADFRTARPGFLLVALRIEAGERRGWVEALARAGFPVVHETKWSIY